MASLRKELLTLLRMPIFGKDFTMRTLDDMIIAITAKSRTKLISTDAIDKLKSQICSRKTTGGTHSVPLPVFVLFASSLPSGLARSAESSSSTLSEHFYSPLLSTERSPRCQRNGQCSSPILPNGWHPLAVSNVPIWRRILQQVLGRPPLVLTR